ncbi:helix-turn-helix domain-containing protein [Roseburia faecis]|uniref:Putative zinc finger/helix-turn-helix protein, YgiT family n=1 Tax=Roseburia faecis TaxID=301302 RepID=A0A173RCH7_9FIRM|nr:helix-turn-helix transcriptional regulator [Roseburia faecis]CUM75660.1 putative zinc finger/helix-turn-helix protein%2C YgiT family [Roseburia faecis]
MKERLKEIRKINPDGKTQETFANYLGISKENIASYESGRRNPSDSFIKLVCEKCNVNEDWLRTGNGEMFMPETKDEQISKMLADVMKSEDGNFKKKLISALAQLDKDGWDKLEDFVDMISKKK